MLETKIKNVDELNNLLISIVYYINNYYQIDEKELENIIYETKIYYIMTNNNNFTNSDLISFDELIKINTSEYIEENKIDFDRIYNNHYYTFLAIDNALIEEKEFVNNHYYEKLLEEKNHGKIFSIDNLNKELLYELLIKEDRLKTEIARLFNINENQLIYLQKKYNLTNRFLKSCIDYPSEVMKKYDEIEFNTIPASYKYIYYLDLKHYKGFRGNWKDENYISYMEERLEKDFSNYHITYKDINIKKDNGKRKKKTNGRKIDQRKAFENRQKSGKIGENIVYNNEIKKLKFWHYNDLISQVKLIPKTDNENITFDGTGYDIVSFNKKKEKIYIEVKTSLAKNDDSPEFFISEAEMRIISGQSDYINKENYFIYYVYNVNRKNKTANISIIDHKKFSTLKKDPILYHVHE